MGTSRRESQTGPSPELFPGRSRGAALKSGQIVYTKIPYSACMNSFRIQRLDSFHAISHGIPIRPGSGPPRRPNRSATARVHDVRLLASPRGSVGRLLVMLVSRLPTDPHVSDAVGSQVTRYARYAPRTLISVLQSRSSCVINSY